MSHQAKALLPPEILYSETEKIRVSADAPLIVTDVRAQRAARQPRRPAFVLISDARDADARITPNFTSTMLSTSFAQQKYYFMDRTLKSFEFYHQRFDKPKS